jgi:hypothetical protein
MFPEFVLKCLEVGGADFRDAEEIQSCVVPAAEVVATFGLDEVFAVLWESIIDARPVREATYPLLRA